MVYYQLVHLEIINIFHGPASVCESFASPPESWHSIEHSLGIISNGAWSVAVVSTPPPYRRRSRNFLHSFSSDLLHLGQKTRAAAVHCVLRRKISPPMPALLLPPRLIIIMCSCHRRHFPEHLLKLFYHHSISGRK